MTLLASLSFGANVATWTNSSLNVSGSLSASTGTGTLSRGAGVAFVSLANNYDSNGLNATSQANAQTGNDYVQITVDTTGYSGIKLLFTHGRTATGPPNGRVMYSSTGTGGAFTNSSIFAPATSDAAATIDLSAIAALNNNPNAVLRLFGWNATAAGGELHINTVSITGNLDPVISAPASLNFGTISAGATLDQNLAVTNNGAANTLTVQNTSTITGADAAKFSIQTALPVSITAANTSNLLIRFNPGATAGTFSATLQIASNDLTTPIKNVTLTGSAAAPVATWSNASLNVNASVNAATGTGVISRGAGVTFATNANTYNENSFTGANQAAAQTGNDYVQITVDTTGFTSILLNFTYGDTNANGPPNGILRYSSTGPGGTFTDSSALTLTTTDAAASVDLSSVTALNSNANVVFRFYFWNAGNNGGQVHLSDISVLGTDIVAPTIASISAPSVSTTNTGPVAYTVSFSESVTGFNAPADITINATGTAAVATKAISGSGSGPYTITLSGITGDGTIGITIPAGAAQDVSSNNNTASSASATFTVDNTAPSVISISAPSSSAASTGPVTYTVDFSESVTGFNAAADIQVNATGTAAAGAVAVSGSGSGPYTVTLSSITGDGALRITVVAGAAQDAAGNNNTVSGASTSFIVDNTAPTVTSISAPSASSTNSGPVTYTVNFSESVTGFFSPVDITVNATSTAAVGSVSISGSGWGPYTVTLSSITGNGTLGITVPAGAAQDQVNLDNTASGASTTFSVDNVAPTVTSLSAPSVSTTNTGPVTYTVDFSESVTGFGGVGAVQVNATGSAAASAAISGSGSGPYTVTLSSITGDGTLGITVVAGAAQDAAGNNNTASSASATFTVDNTVPTVNPITGPSVSPTNTGPVTYTVNFSESVTGFIAAADIQVNSTGGAAAGSVAISGSGSGPYTVTLSSITGNGTIGITVKASAAQDAAGNNNTVSTGSTSFTVDNIAPAVNPITGPSVAATNTGPVTYTVNFNGAVTGFDTSADIQVNSTGGAAAGSVAISGSGSGPYTVTLSSITGNGTLGITIKAGAAQDAAGNNNTVSAASTTFTVDNIAPTVNPITGPSVTLASAGPVTYTVNFNGAVSGFTTASDIQVNATGTASPGSIVISGSGAGPYTVTLSGITGDGTLGITVVAGAAQDAAGNDNTVSADSATFNVDTTAPTVTSISSPSVADTTAGPVTYTVNFSETVTGFNAASDIQVDATGTAAAGSVAVSGSGAGPYTVTLSSLSGDGTLGITVKAAAGQDAAGNDNDASVASANFNVDNTAPTLSSTIGLVDSNPTSANSVNFDVDFSESVGATFTNADVTVNGGMAIASVVVTGGPAVYNVKVNFSNPSENGTVGITIGTAVTDAAGNAFAGATSGTYTINNTIPSVAIVNNAPLTTSGGPVFFTVTYGNSTSISLAPADITVNTTGTAVFTPPVIVTGTGLSPRVVRLNGLSGDGTISISIAANTATNGVANASAAGPSGDFTIDNTAPFVNSTSAPTSSTVSSGPVSFTLDFSESVTGFDSAADIALNATGTAAAGSVAVSGSGSGPYTVTLSGITGDGTLGITAVAGAASDTVGNVSTVSAPSATFTVDNTAPTITSISAPSASSTAGGPVTYTVNFSEAVTGFDSLGDVQINATGDASPGSVSISGSGAGPYTVTLSSITGDGTLGISIPAAAAQDQVGIDNIASAASATFTVDNTAPVVTATSAPSVSPTNSGPVSFTVDFNESVTGFNAAADIQVTATSTAAAGSVAVSGSGPGPYTVTLSSITGNGTLRIMVKAGAAQDAVGNSNTVSAASAAVTVDNTKPTITTISAPSPSVTAGGPIVYTVNFSEAVTGFDSSSDVQLTATGTAAAGLVSVSGSGSGPYTVTVSSITGNGTIRISVPAASAQDQAGNGNTASALSATFTADNTAPTITSITGPSVAQTASGPVSYTVNFSEAVTGFNSSGDVQVNTSGTSQVDTVAVSGSGSGPYTVTLSTISGDGTVTISIPSGGAQDAAGNDNTASSVSASLTVDNTPPTISSISAPSATATNTGPVTFTVNFSESVTGFTGATDIQVNSTGTAAAGSVAISGSGSGPYTVTLSSITGAGTLGISIPANAAQDAAGNDSTASGASATFTVDNTPPSISSISAPSAAATAAGPVSYMINFSEPVTGFDTAADVTLHATGSAAASSVVITGSGAGPYTVTLSGATGDGTLAISIPAGAAQDPAGNNNTASVTSAAFTVDNTAPTVTSISAPSASIAAAGPVSYTVNFSEAVTGFDAAADVTIQATGTATAGLVSITGSGSGPYTVRLSSLSGDGTLAISVVASAAHDAAGNNSVASAPSASFAVDNSAPSVTSISAPSVSSTSAGPVTYTVNFSEAVTGFDSASDVQLNASGTATAAVGVSGSGAGPYTITLSGLTGAGTLEISIRGHVAQDSAGNGNTASAASAAVTVDNTPPTIVDISDPTVIVTTGGPVDYAINFSEAVTGFDVATDVQVIGTGTAAVGAIGLSGSGSGPYTVTLSGITGDGTIAIAIPAGSAQDAVGNNNTASATSATFIVDNTAPVLASPIGLVDGNPTSADSVNFDVEFNENVDATFTEADVTVNGGMSVGSVVVTGGPTVFNVQVNLSNPNENGTVGITIGNAVTDAAGNAFAGATSATYTIDDTVPSVAITEVPPLASAAGPVAFTLTYDNVTSISLAPGDVTVNTTGTAAFTPPVVVSGAGFEPRTVTLSGLSGDGTIRISIAANTATNGVANASAAGPSAPFTIDNTAPVVNSISVPSASTTVVGPVSYTVSFSEDVTGFDSPTDVQVLSTGDAAATTITITGSGAGPYTVTLSDITGNGSLGILIPAGATLDQANNTNAASAPSAFFTVDSTMPTVIAISSPSVNATSAGPVTYTIDFSEVVTGFDSPSDILVTATGTAAVGLVSISGSGSGPYTVQLSSLSGDGLVDIKVLPGAAQDLTGNLNVASGTSAAVMVDNTVPTVSSVSAPTPSMTNSGPVTYTVNFSESVTGFDTDTDLEVNATGTAAAASVSINGTGAGPYTVTLSGLTGEGTLGITVPAGVAHDVAGNDNIASLPSLTVAVDDIRPKVASISLPSVTKTTSGPVDFTVTFSEAVTGFDSSSDVQVNSTGSAAAATVTISGSGAGPYTVTLSGITGDGTLGITVLADTAQDGAGNGNDSDVSPVTVVVDNSVPTVTSISTPSEPATAAGPITYFVVFSEPVTGFDLAADVQVNATGSAAVGSISISGAGSGPYAVVLSAITGDGTIAITIPATVQDGAGNTNIQSSPSSTFSVDNTSPLVADISVPSAPVTNSGPVAFAINFSEPVTGFDSAGDIQVISTGTAAAGLVTISGSGSGPYFAILSNLTGDGTLSIAVVGSAGQDGAGNGSFASAPSSTFEVDNTPPAVSSISAPSVAQTINGPVSYTVNFSEPVTGFGSSSSVQLNRSGGATVGSVSVTGSGAGPYTVTLLGIVGPGSVSITVAANADFDLAGNGNLSSAPSAAFTVGAPEISVDASLLNFPARVVGTGPSGHRIVRITNVGTSDLHFTGAGIALAGPDAGHFDIINNPPITPLAPGATRNVNVVFDPLSAGVKHAVLRITTDDADEATVDVGAVGTGIPTGSGPSQNAVGKSWQRYE